MNADAAKLQSLLQAAHGAQGRGDASGERQRLEPASERGRTQILFGLHRRRRRRGNALAADHRPDCGDAFDIGINWLLQLLAEHVRVDLLDTDADVQFA